MEKSTTDVFMSIEAEEANKIACGRRSHQYRNYALPPTVERIWLYSKFPMNLFEYVICISHDGTIPSDSNGRLRYAYKIHQVWMLRRPVGIEQAISMGILARAPAKYTWVPKSFLQERPYNTQFHLRQR